MEDNKELFAGFPDISKEQWTAQAVRDLKGADFTQTLCYTTADGLEIGPFYTIEDLPSVSGPLFAHTDWDICVRIPVTDERTANRQALHQLNNGATGLIFTLNAAADLEVLLQDIQVAYILVQFRITDNPAGFSNALNAYLGRHGLDRSAINIRISYDPIGHLVRTGSWSAGQQPDTSAFTALAESDPRICIDGSIYHDAGAAPAFGLGCLLAHAHEYLHLLAEQTIAPALQITVAPGADYFMAISKLRALRRVFALLLRSYGMDPAIQVQAVSATRSLTIYDKDNNLLRTTTEAMAAAAGGCNSLVVLPFDAIFRAPDEFSDRMARNIQLILKHESHFDKVADVSAGSYFIETLTEQLAAKAWEDFREIEARGGFLRGLQDGWIQERIRTMAQEEQQLFDDQQKILVGTNKFPHPGQQMAGMVTLPVLPEHHAGTAVRPLQPQRLAATTEAARLAAEGPAGQQG